MATAKGKHRAMREWSIAISGAAAISEENADDLLDALADRAPVVSFGPTGMSVRFNVTASTAQEAVEQALELFGGLSVPLDIEALEAETAEALERHINEPNAPELVGVAEVADLLGVSKQRVSELAKGHSFPRPLAELAAGPVWDLASLQRFATNWKRLPGRPHESARR